MTKKKKLLIVVLFLVLLIVGVTHLTGISTAIDFCKSDYSCVSKIYQFCSLSEIKDVGITACYWQHTSCPVGRVC